MTTTADRPDTRPVAAEPAPASQRSRALLTCGAIAGPLFVGVAALQVAFRDGFDLTRHPLSLLSLGGYGWIQVANFIVAGVLCLPFAVGVRRVLHPGRAGTWGPRLLGAYGAGQVVAGLFSADPSVGFPAGAPEGNPAQVSWHAILHGVGAMVAFPALIVACFVLARRFAALRRAGWATYSVATGVAALALVAWPDQDGLSVRLAVGALITSGWLSALAASLLTEAGRAGG